jgi:hypothetical protein
MIRTAAWSRRSARGTFDDGVVEYWSNGVMGSEGTD